MTDYSSTHENTEVDHDNELENNNEEEEEEITISDETKEKIAKYISIDNIIRQKQEDIKELKKQKVPLEKYILEYMKKNDIPSFNLESGKLIFNRSTTKGPLTIDTISDSINELSKKVLKDDKKTSTFTNDILKLMDEKRANRVKINLKRTFKRKT